MKNGHKKSAVFLIAASGILWGTYGTFVNFLSSYGLSAIQITQARLIVTTFSVGLILLLTKKKEFRIKRQDILWFVLNGTTSVAVFAFCYTAAIRVTKIAIAASLLYTAPAIVLLLSAFCFKEKISCKKVFCVCLSVIWCALVSGLSFGGIKCSLLGFFLGISSGIGYALYSIYSRILLNKGYSSMTNVFYTFLFASIVCSFFSPIHELTKICLMKPNVIVLCILCGILTGSLAYVIYTYGLRNIESSYAAQIATLEPVTASILGLLLFHQTLSQMECIGIFLTLTAALLANDTSSLKRSYADKKQKKVRHSF